MQKHRQSSTHFTRQRELTFPTLIRFFLNLIKGSLQSELNHFFEIAQSKRTPLMRVTASAFCRARKKLSPQVFIDLNHQAVDEFYHHADIETWNDFRVLAIDGSKYHVPSNAQTAQTFGSQFNQYATTVPMARGSCLYDVFQGIVLDAQITACDASERELAYQHLGHTGSNDLMLYDRGYPAFWLFAAHRALQRDYCMRVTTSFNLDVKAFVASSKKQAIIHIKPNAVSIRRCREKGLSIEPIKVRLVRVKTQRGEYVLMTSLLDKQRYPVKCFKTLYHLRWQIEESYKQQKNWLEIENFSGKSVLSIQQDFHAKMLCLSLTAMSLFAAQEKIKSSVAERYYAYKINFSAALSSMKDTIVHLLSKGLDEFEWHRWLTVLSRCLIPIRPKRSFPRKASPRPRRTFRSSYRRAL